MDEPKKDNRPSTEDWYQTVLKIKKFCEEKEIQLVHDTAYGWLATFFYQIRDEL